MLIEMQRLSVAQLLAVYNFHTTPKVVRFESHAAGAKRLRALLAKIEISLEDAFYATFPVQSPKIFVDAAKASGTAQEAAVAMVALHEAGLGRKIEVAGKVKPAKAPLAATPSALPAPPDFSANTHKPYRAKLAKLVELAEAGDIAALEAIEIKPTSSSPKALIRYRDRVIAAIREAA